MTFLWFVTGAALVAALAAWRQARRTAQQLKQLSEQYWDLKYQYGELRVQLQRQSGEAPPAAAPAARTSTQAFVPLTSLKR